MINLKEMNKLRAALDEHGIAWEDKSHYSKYFPECDMIRTHFTNKHGEKCSVICGLHSYGGEYGMLESMPRVHVDDDPYANTVEGFLLAQEIIDEWL